MMQCPRCGFYSFNGMECLVSTCGYIDRITLRNCRCDYIPVTKQQPENNTICPDFDLDCFLMTEEQIAICIEHPDPCGICVMRKGEI